MIRNHNHRNILDITLNTQTIELLNNNDIYGDEFINKLYCILSRKEAPLDFEPYQGSKFVSEIIKKVSFTLIHNDFPRDDVALILNSLEPEDIIEKAAIGFFFSLLLYGNHSIDDFHVINRRGLGFDYVGQEIGRDGNVSTIIFEFSGCDANSTHNFQSRISNKNGRLREKSLEQLVDSIMIGVVGFSIKKYIYCERVN
ncbi:MAG: hypothetical protein GF364_14375 [Candidatus Lokiarchaeota archaeon]|nr:hypothetical protein [Candidatus Lokiarchaeota archaeon]